MNIQRDQGHRNTGKTTTEKIILRVVSLFFFLFDLYTNAEARQALLSCLKMEKSRHELKRDLHNIHRSSGNNQELHSLVF